MRALLLLVAALSGVTSALQAGTNATLQKALGSPVWAVAFVCTVTVSTALLVASIFGGPFPTRVQLAAPPWWAWAGGMLGVIYVLATVFASPKLGAGVFVALVVTASVLTSLLLDHFGLMGFEVHQAGVGRILGGLLMVAGVACIAAF